MDQKIKNYFGIGAIFSVAILAISSLFFAYTYSKSISIRSNTYRNFSVNGEGKIIAVPDIALFSFSVVTEGDRDIVAIQHENTKHINDAITLLKEEDIEDEDISTNAYNLQPRYQHFDCLRSSLSKECLPQSPEIIGYTINQTISVKIRDIKKAGQILSKVTQSGANSISGLSFEVNDKKEDENNARQKAIADATKKAELIAQAGNFKLGKILSIRENSSPIYYRAAAAPSFGSLENNMGVSPDIKPGSQEIMVGVTINYEIR